MVAQRDVLEMLRDAAVRALDESWDLELPSTLLERAWVAELRGLRRSLRGAWGELGLDVLLRGVARDPRFGAVDPLIFGMSVDTFVVTLGAATEGDAMSTDDVISAAKVLLDRSRYREPELTGPAIHAAIDVVRAAHTLMGLILHRDAFARIRELTANAEALEWDIHDRIAWEAANAEDDSGPHRSILERLPLFRGLRPRRRGPVPEPQQLLPGHHVNIAILAATGNAEHLPRVTPGSRIWLAVSVGPHWDDEATGLLPPFSLPKRVRRELVDVVVLADPSGAQAVADPPSGQVRISSDGPFSVTRPAGIGPVGNADSRRLYFPLRAPEEPGDWQVRCVLAVRGAVVHVEHVTVVVGESEAESSAHTTFRLVEDLADPEALDGLEAPTVAMYACGDDRAQGFSFLLADENGIDAAQANLDPERVTDFIEAVREALDEITWVVGGPSVQGEVTWHSWNWAAIGDPSEVARHLVALARAGRLVWQDLDESLDRSPGFARQLAGTLRTPGAVQVAIGQDTTHVLPVQFLYDLPLAATEPFEDLSVCDATRRWLATQADGPSSVEGADVDGPPCIAATCPQDGDLSRVCIAGFWGYRHRVTSNLDSATALIELATALHA